MLKRFKDTYKDGTCVIIGNGPSLKETPRKLLDDQITFGANKIYALWNDEPDIPEQLAGFVPDHYTIIDEKMLIHCGPFLNLHPDYPPVKFVRKGYKVKGGLPINCVVKPGFSSDINIEVVMGGTVVYAMLQIAFYMGFRTALLVGVDHRYKIGRRQLAFLRTGCSYPICRNGMPCTHLIIGQINQKILD